MGLFNLFSNKKDGIVKPVNEAWFDNNRQVWLQDYEVVESGVTKVKRYMHNGQSWVEDNYVDTTPVAMGEAIMGADGIWRQDYKVYENNQWIVKRFKYENNNWTQDEGSLDSTTNATKKDLTALIPNTADGINLKKSTINLDKSLIDLSKKSGIELSKHRARVAVVLDYSGSMCGLYDNGSIQRVLNRLMPLALRFDDNGELDAWLFHEHYHRIESMTLKNFNKYVKKEIKGKGYKMGGTSYAPVLQDVVRHYFVENIDRTCPTFVIFITDGDNFDTSATDQVVRDLSEKDIFIQFVGIGNESFRYLERLDNLTGRRYDNTGFIKVKDFDRLNDEELYNKLLEQYPQWLGVKGWR